MENPLGKGYVIDEAGNATEVSKDGKKVKDVVIIDRAEYDALVEDSAILRALEAAGVDNWEGYDIAMDMRDDEE